MLQKTPGLPQFASNNFKKSCWGERYWQPPDREITDEESSAWERDDCNGHVPEDCNIIIGQKKVKTKAFALSHNQTQGSVFIPPCPLYFF